MKQHIQVKQNKNVEGNPEKVNKTIFVAKSMYFKRLYFKTFLHLKNQFLFIKIKVYGVNLFWKRKKNSFKWNSKFQVKQK